MFVVGLVQIQLVKFSFKSFKYQICILGQTDTFLVRTIYTISLCLYVYISIIAALVSWDSQIVAKLLYNQGLSVLTINVAYCISSIEYIYFTIRVCLYVHTFVILAHLFRDTLLSAKLLYTSVCLFVYLTIISAQVSWDI